MIKIFNNTYPIGMRCLYQKKEIIYFIFAISVTGIRAYNKMRFLALLKKTHKMLDCINQDINIPRV